MIPHYSPCSGYTTSQNDWVSLGRETFLRNLSLLNHEQACYCKQQGTDPEKMTSQRVTSTDECFSGKPDSAFLEYHSISKFHQALQHCNSVLICCTSLGGMLQFLLTFFPALFFFLNQGALPHTSTHFGAPFLAAPPYAFIQSIPTAPSSCHHLHPPNLLLSRLYSSAKSLSLTLFSLRRKDRNGYTNSPVSVLVQIQYTLSQPVVKTR